MGIALLRAPLSFLFPANTNLSPCIFEAPG